jgi:hypothetical protein
VDIDTVADELYGLRPEDFTAARNARMAEARTAGDRALAERIGTLRRPSLSAWVSNLLVREQPGEVQPLLRLGEGLRQAHHALDGTQLRELSRQQHRLIGALSRQARQLAAQAGHPVGDDVQREVENTLHAVLADPAAADEWAAGRLVKPLTAGVGFPAEAAASASGAAGRRAPATPTEAPKAPTARPARSDRQSDELRQRRLARARKEAEKAARELRARKTEATAAGRDAKAADRRAEQLQRRVGKLAEELKSAEAEYQQALSAQAAAREGVRAADERVAEAGRHAEDTAAEADRLAAGDS